MFHYQTNVLQKKTTLEDSGFSVDINITKESNTIHRQQVRDESPRKFLASLQTLWRYENAKNESAVFTKTRPICSFHWFNPNRMCLN